MSAPKQIHQPSPNCLWIQVKVIGAGSASVWVEYPAPKNLASHEVEQWRIAADIALRAAVSDWLKNIDLDTVLEGKPT